MNYGLKLKELRERLGLTFVEMGKIINVSDSLYSRYEKEKQTIPLKHLITVCNYFDVSLDYILGFNESKKYSSNNNLDMKKVSLRIKSFRKEINLTQLQIANFLHIDQPTWSIYESGKSLIGLPFLFMICKKYNISADYLLGKTDSPKYLK